MSPLVELDGARRVVAKWAVDCGSRVVARRKALGMDQETLAALAGTTKPTISRIESGQINPRDHLKLAIANALAVEVETIWPYLTRERLHSEIAAVA